MDRLLPTRKIDDRKPTHRESDIIPEIKSILIRPAMYDRAVHPRKELTVHRLVFIRNSYDSTHNISSSKVPCDRSAHRVVSFSSIALFCDFRAFPSTVPIRQR